MTASLYIAHRRDEAGETQPLASHLVEVSKLCLNRAAKLGLQSQGELIGLLHDIGKYSDEFQAYLGSAVGLIEPDSDDFVDSGGLRGRIDHSTSGAQVIWQELSRLGCLEQIIGQVLALCVASHHSGMIDCISSTPSHPPEDVFLKRMAKDETLTHRRAVTARLDASIAARMATLFADKHLVQALKDSFRLVMEENAIGGLDPHLSTITQFKLGLLTRFLYSCLLDADRVDTADFQRPDAGRSRPSGTYAEWSVLTGRLESHLKMFSKEREIDVLRGRISEACRDRAVSAKGIYTLTVPTGGGKTLASLRFALHHAMEHKMDRVIYVVPFTTIIDQNAGEVRKILEPRESDCGHVVLEHHSNLTPERQGWREKMLAENWDAPVVFTTSVQLLETLFGGGTRGPRRMHQLANSVLVFDEIQSLPIDCVHIFCNAMNFLVERCRSTVVLCTATQPLLNRVDSIKGAMRYGPDSEIIAHVAEVFECMKRVEVMNQRKPGGWTDAEIVDLAGKEVADAGSCLIVVNTKRSARAIYKLAREELNIPVYHLSTNMCPAHRKIVLAAVSERLDCELPVLCVSTQLIEAGVDMDFGCVVRFMAGLDSIAQAAGRCNRNGRRATGRVHVINPAKESIGMLRDIQCGKEITERLLHDVADGEEDFGDDLLGPEAMRQYFNYFFFARRDRMDYPVSESMAGRSDTLLNLLSTNTLALADYARSHGRAPEIYLRQSFAAAGRAFQAIDAPTRGVIVPYGKAGKALIGDLCSAFNVEKQGELLRRAQQYSVNVFPQVLMRLENAVYPIQKGVDVLYLADGYYHEEFGLSPTPTGEMEFLNG